MNEKMTIRIKKPTQSEALIGILMWLPFLSGFLIQFLRLPSMIMYTCDVAWMSLLVLLMIQQVPMGAPIKRLASGVVVFLVYTALIYVVQYQSILYYLWGLRNNFRFFVAFFAFAAFLKPQDIRGYYKLFDVLFWINVAVSLFQFYVLGLASDYLGGIFGVGSGSNGYTNIFLAIIVARSMLLYLSKREKTWYTIIKCVAVLFIAALAELKFFFAEFLLILVLSILFTSFTWRKFWLIVGGIAAVTVFSAVLVTIFPDFAGFLTWEFFLETGLSDKGYTSSGDLNRLNAISQINELWLHNGGQRLFGLGLGNCDTSEVAALNTPFFQRYGDMHYSWLSVAFMYLECGWTGLIFYFGFFVAVFLEIRKIEKSSDENVKLYCRISRIIAVMCIIFAIYNSSLRSESAYMVFFVLAVPFALREKTQKASK